MTTNCGRMNDSIPRHGFSSANLRRSCRRQTTFWISAANAAGLTDGIDQLILSHPVPTRDAVVFRQSCQLAARLCLEVCGFNQNSVSRFASRSCRRADDTAREGVGGSRPVDLFMPRFARGRQPTRSAVVSSRNIGLAPAPVKSPAAAKSPASLKSDGWWQIDRIGSWIGCSFPREWGQGGDTLPLRNS